jgi:hypothetical protein
MEPGSKGARTWCLQRAPELAGAPSYHYRRKLSTVHSLMLFILGAALVVAAWWWLAEPTARFIRGFAALLDPPAPDFSPAALLGWAQSVGGRFNGRAVTLRLSQPGENRFGEILLSMQTSAPDGAPWKDSSLTGRDADLSRVTFDLEGRHGLILALEDGWLRALSSPPLLVTRFPGSFDPKAWGNILKQMDALATWLEGSSKRSLT